MPAEGTTGPGRAEPRPAVIDIDLIVANVQGAVIATDLDGRIVYWSPFAERLYGWQADEVIGRDAVDLLVPGETQSEARQIMGQLRARSWAGEFTLRPRVGHPFPLRIRAGPVLDQSGATIGIVGVADEAVRSEQSPAPSTGTTKLLTLGLILATGLMALIATILVLADRALP